MIPILILNHVVGLERGRPGELIVESERRQASLGAPVVSFAEQPICCDGNDLTEDAARLGKVVTKL